MPQVTTCCCSYFDALEVLPAHVSPELLHAQSCRYDSQLAVFGRSIQEALGDLKVFLIGAGALGCELLKNFAMMGIGCGPGGKVVVTDNDHIEKSNLSRQFLFRSHHVGLSKSACAAECAKSINGGLKSTPSPPPPTLLSLTPSQHHVARPSSAHRHRTFLRRHLLVLHRRCR